MKHSLVLVPILLLVLLNACSANPNPDPEVMRVALAQTMTAMSWTPTPQPTSTTEPNELLVVNYLNGDFSANTWDQNFLRGVGGPGDDPALAVNLNQLEDHIGADFLIFDVRFPPGANNISLVFQIHARCECATNGPCCTPEHMFVLTMKQLFVAVQQQSSALMGQVPQTVEEMEVVCYDHRNVFAVMSVPWQDVQSFLRREISGSMLGARVQRE